MLFTPKFHCPFATAKSVVIIYLQWFTNCFSTNWPQSMISHNEFLVVDMSLEVRYGNHTQTVTPLDIVLDPCSIIHMLLAFIQKFCRNNHI